jgi:acyl-CoA dehydrogenase
MPMGCTLRDELNNLRQLAQDFAAQNIAGRSELSSNTLFPMDLWRSLGRSGLLGISTPKDFGGQGLGYKGISVAGRALARHGLCLGITLSWLMHQITARFFLGSFPSEGQRHRLLPGIATGDITASIAISEPGVGGHPKHLKAMAEKTGSGYLITGEKTFLTNGPIADIFIVFAISSQEGERKRYSAFMVAKDNPGLRLTEPLDFGFLRPCPHGGIILDGCIVSADDMIGNPGKAYEDMALPFREIEDIMMMGPILGAQEARLDGIVSVMHGSAVIPPEDIAFLLGGISSVSNALDVIALEACRRLEDGDNPKELPKLILAFRRLNSQIHQELEEVASLSGIIPSGAYQVLTHDLDHIGRFAGRVSKLKQIRLGEALIENKSH